MTPSPKTSAIRDQVSEAEWQARVALAAAYRLVALWPGLLRKLDRIDPTYRD